MEALLRKDQRRTALQHVSNCISPAMLAIELGNEAILNLMLKGRWWSTVTLSTKIPGYLVAAAHHGHAHIVEMLIARYKDVLTREAYNRALVAAATSGSSGCLSKRF